MISLIFLSMLAVSLATSNTCNNYCGRTAVLVPGVGGPATAVSESAYYFYNNTYAPSVYITSTSASCPIQLSINGNTLTINGTVAAIDGSNAGFYINYIFTSTNGNNPLLELQPGEYVANGGTIDPSTFSYWSLTQGTLTGYGTYQGVVLTMSEFMHPLMIGVGANGKNLNFGASGWFSYTANGITYQTDLNLDLNCSTPAPVCKSNYYCGSSAILDRSVGPSESVDESAYYFWNNSYPYNIYITPNVSCPILLHVSGNTLTIQGTVVIINGSNAGFYIDFNFTSTNGNNPLLELQPDQYVSNGGTIDPSTFSYWSLTQGTLTGFGVYQGVVLTVSEFMHPLMIGIGGNGKNLDFGASGWFSYLINGQTYQTDLNLDLTCYCDANVTCSSHGSCNDDGSCACDTGYTGENCDQCASGYYDYPYCVPNPCNSTTSFCGTTAVLDRSVGPSGSVDQSAYYFYNNTYAPSVYITSTSASCPIQLSISGNTLTIQGTVVAIDGSNAGFYINYIFTSTNGNNPLLELQPNQYVANGGTIDPSTFSYWSLTQGTLTGYGTYQGVVLTMSEFMHPLMIGVGANGKNLNFGAGGWFSYTANGITYQTDLNLDLSCSSNATTSPTTAPTTTPTATPCSVTVTATYIPGTARFVVIDGINRIAAEYQVSAINNGQSTVTSVAITFAPYSGSYVTNATNNLVSTGTTNQYTLSTQLSSRSTDNTSTITAIFASTGYSPNIPVSSATAQCGSGSSTSTSSTSSSSTSSTSTSSSSTSGSSTSTPTSSPTPTGSGFTGCPATATISQRSNFTSGDEVGILYDFTITNTAPYSLNTVELNVPVDGRGTVTQLWNLIQTCCTQIDSFVAFNATVFSLPAGQTFVGSGFIYTIPQSAVANYIAPAGVQVTNPATGLICGLA